MSKNTRWTIEKIQEIADKSGVTVLSNEYVNTLGKLKFRCSCGNEFSRSMSTFVHAGVRHCPECGKKNRKPSTPRKWNNDSVREFILQESTCEPLEDYPGYCEKMKLKCGCGCVFSTSFQYFKTENKRQCDECGKENMKMKMRYKYDGVTYTDELLLEKLSEEISSYGCVLLSKEYKDSTTPLELMCGCGNTMSISLANFRKGQRTCRACSNQKLREKFRTPYETVKSQIEINGCELLTKPENYVNSKTKVDIRCGCGNTFKRTVEDFKINRPQCTECSSSIPESKIRSYLAKRGVSFKREYTFGGLVGNGGGLLRFDFAIFDRGELKGLVEYDGEFHFFKLYEGQKYDDIVTHDLLKNRYCEDRNIPLLRINYTEENEIESLLDVFLVHLGVCSNEVVSLG